MKKIFLLFTICNFLWAYSHYPGRYEIIEEAGSTVTYNITLLSNKDFTENVTIALNTWYASPETNISFYPLTGNFVNLSSSSFDLPPGSRYSLDVGITVPKIEGEKRFEVAMSSHIPNSTFGLTKSVLFFMIIKDTEIVKLNLKSFDILVEGNTLKVKSGVENLGNIHLRPRIEMKVTNEDGTDEWVRVADDIPVYPYSTRILEKDIEKKIKKGEQSIEVKMLFYDTKGNLISQEYKFRKNL